MGYINPSGSAETPSATAASPWLIVALICAGLYIDQHVPVWGQPLVAVAAWALLFCWMLRAGTPARLRLIVCVVLATAGEIFLSLVWGLYDYRLGNIPLFVPPGHALLFALGLVLAGRLPDWIVVAVPALTAPLALWLAVSGSDTLGPLFFSLLLVCMAFSRARKLYAVMFMLALAMEIYGTTLGNWRWRAEVPWLGLATLNPPLTAGALYCMLDMLVVATTPLLQRRLAAARAG